MKIAVVIPCYKVKQYVLGVISSIGEEVSDIYCVDDACPEKSGNFIEINVKDQRVKVIYHSENQGVGGAVMTGYKAALKEGAGIIVKIDGDGQMDPALIPKMVLPILENVADYTKGNRFFLMKYLKGMPVVRKAGNAALSLISKFSTGYWDIFDPTNGYTAIAASVVSELQLDKISKRYFFESDMLFQLNILRAVVKDIPITATYQGEISSLKINKIIFDFMGRHCSNFVKRIFYNYLIRNFTLGSIELFLSFISICSGCIIGGTHWFDSIHSGVAATSGTVMLSALPIVVGFQLLLAFFGEDINMVPRFPVNRLLGKEMPGSIKSVEQESGTVESQISKIIMNENLVSKQEIKLEQKIAETVS